MKILVDMDGILVNTMPEFLARFNRRTGSHYHMRDLTSFKVNDVFGPEAREVFLEKDFFYSLKPLPGAIDAFNELRKHHEVRVATSAYGPESAKAKLDWCDRHFKGLRWHDIVIGGKKERIDADILIDDKPSTMRAWMATWRCGISIAWPWNRELEWISSLHAQSGAESEKAWQTILEFIARLPQASQASATRKPV